MPLLFFWKNLNLHNTLIRKNGITNVHVPLPNFNHYSSHFFHLIYLEYNFLPIHRVVPIILESAYVSFIQMHHNQSNHIVRYIMLLINRLKSTYLSTVWVYLWDIPSYGNDGLKTCADLIFIGRAKFPSPKAAPFTFDPVKRHFILHAFSQPWTLSAWFLK